MRDDDTTQPRNGHAEGAVTSTMRASAWRFVVTFGLSACSPTSSTRARGP